MESLDGTEWDIVIAGTGLHESLLALALSRSGKKILHIDQYNRYGGAESTLSLQEATDFIEAANDPSKSSYFSNVQIVSSVVDEATPIPEQASSTKLSFSRAYALSLSPHVVYSRSAILPALVAAKVDAHLEFLILGSWWVYNGKDSGGDGGQGQFSRVPSGREDLFADQTLDMKTKRAFTKFLRFIADLENQDEILEQHGQAPFSEFLESQFKLHPSIQQPIHALAMSSSSLTDTTTAFAVPRIARYLRSIGLFGPGFGAVIPKWGGLAEITQVACRACAVGGGVYHLGNGLKTIIQTDTRQSAEVEATASELLSLEMHDGSKVKSTWLVAGPDCLPDTVMTSGEQAAQQNDDDDNCVTRAIYIISSDLAHLFPTLQEGFGRPAGAVVVFPPAGTKDPPIHLIAHNSDTGECPVGQCVVYGNIAGHTQSRYQALDDAVEKLLSGVAETPLPQILWKMQYKQGALGKESSNKAQLRADLQKQVLQFPSPSLDITFDDAVLDRVRQVWLALTEADPDSFLQFRPRGEAEDEDDIR